MKKVTLKDVLTISNRTINSLDERLFNHGEQVAYIMLNLLRVKGGYSDKEISRICSLAMFHDIGAYKVAERDKLIEIDSIKPQSHAVYGALFIKYFSPLSNLYKIVLGHHLAAKDIKNNNTYEIQNESLLLGLSDYISIINLNKKLDGYDYLNKVRDTYLDENIDLFIKADEKYNIIRKLNSNKYSKELYDFFGDKELSRDEIIGYTKMLTYAIDFRSEATVRHTILVEAISSQIARLYGLEEEQIQRIEVAATLHDIGKITIPVEILEKPGKLTEEEYEIIKGHAMNGYNILSGLNIDDIRDVAALHHEKLDGTGYPFGMNGEKISKEVRIVAVADILSALLGERSYKEEFSKEEVQRILVDMVKRNKIDSEIVDIVLLNYEYVIMSAKRYCKELLEVYENIKFEYKVILEMIS